MSEWQELRSSKVSGYRSRRVYRTHLAAVSVDGWMSEESQPPVV